VRSVIAFWTEETNSEACFDFPVPAPLDRNRREYMSCQFDLSCSRCSVRERSLQVFRIDRGVAGMSGPHRSWIQEDMGERT
jgi:hypothetical protein